VRKRPDAAITRKKYLIPSSQPAGGKILERTLEPRKQLAMKIIELIQMD
jgi:hypothetical protein